MLFICVGSALPSFLDLFNCHPPHTLDVLAQSGSELRHNVAQLLISTGDSLDAQLADAVF
jgi:hypothetical protein